MKKNKILSIIFIFCITLFICYKNINRNYISINSKNYANSSNENFELELQGSTGWATTNLSMTEGSSSQSTVIKTVTAGEPFLILGETGNYWKIKYADKIGYVNHNYCMINLPDIVPSIEYSISNASSSIYKSSGIVIPDVTGEQLYTASKVMNNKIGREEYIVPSLYSTAKMIAAAQQLALKDGYSLKIYDSYRPFSVSAYVAEKFNALYNSNTTVKNNVDYSTGASGTQYYWPKTYFISQVSKGSHISTHNVAAAIDVTLCDKETREELVMPTAMHELSTAAIKYYSTSAPKNSSGYSTGMLNSPNARLLDNYMTSVNMTTLASEWWHFQDQTGFERIRDLTNYYGCDFQVTSIVSKTIRPEFFNQFAEDEDLKTVGDLNADGNIDSSDAYLILQLYNYLKENSDEYCDTLITYADVDSNGIVDTNDIFLVLNNNLIEVNDKYIINTNKNYIYTNTDTTTSTINSNIHLSNVNDVTGTIENNKYIVKYNNEVIKEFKIINISSEMYDLTKPYLIEEEGIQVILNAAISEFIKCTNCYLEANETNDKIYIKYEDEILKEYDYVNYTSEMYDLTKPYLIEEEGIQVILNAAISEFIECTNCYLEANETNDKIYIKYEDEILKEYDYVNYTSDMYDLTKPYLIEEEGIQVILNAAISEFIECTNCYLETNETNDKIYIKYDNEILKEYDYVNYTSNKYDLSNDTIKVNDNNIESFLSNINCTNCNAYIYDGTNYQTTGDFSDSSKLVFKYNDEILKKYNLTFNVSSVNIGSNNISLNLGNKKTYKLMATVNPLNAENKNITWESSNPSVATVDNKGLVTAIGLGETTITVKTEDGEFTDTCNVVVGEITTYTVTFIDRENTYTAEFEENEDVVFKTDLEREGYKLIGWRYNNKNYTLTDKLTMPSNDIELTALWEILIPEETTYTVTFVDENNTYTAEFEENEDVVFKTDLEKPGYILIGWKYNNQEYKLTDKLNMPSNNIELTAIWELVIPEIKNYESDDSNITGINLNTNIDDLNLGIDSIYTTKIFKDDKEKASGLIGTGDKVKIYLDNQLVSEYEVCIKGDVNGDGTLSISDITALYKYLRGKRTLEGSYRKASDVNSDTNISLSDITKLYKVLRGKSNL